MTKQPELFWGMIASMWLGNLMLLVINLPLVGLWVKLLRVPYRLMFPSILVFCCIGVYSINSSPLDVIIAALSGLFGYWLIKHDFETAPLLLGFVLGRLMEENLVRSMLIYRDPSGVSDATDLRRSFGGGSPSPDCPFLADDQEAPRSGLR